MQTLPQAAPANFGGEVVNMMKLILWCCQNPAVTIGKNYSENGFPRTSARETNIILSSPIKKQRTGFRTKLLFWKQRDNPGGSYLEGQSGGLKCNMEETMDMAGAGEKAE
jgi:hypothetical protein